MHPSTEEKLRYFEYAHLPEPLQEISKTFHDLAHKYAVILDGNQLTLGLQKLIEAKDCMVRAALPKEGRAYIGTPDCQPSRSDS